MESQRFKLNSFLSIFFVSVFGLYLLIPERQESLSVIIMLVSSIIIFIFKNKKTNKESIFHLFKLSSIFILFLISALLSKNWDVAFKRLETMSSLLIIPFCFFFLLGKSNLDLYKLKKLFYKTFFISNIVFCAICIYLYSTYSNPRYPNKDANFFRNALLENTFIGDHPIYISIFLSLTIIIGISFIDFKKGNPLKNVFILFGLGLICINLILLMSKGVILALLISLMSMLIFHLKLKSSLVIFTVLAFSGLIYLLTPSQNNRFKEIFYKESYASVDTNNSTAIRTNIIKCSFKLILQKPILGYGLGDVQAELNKCYKDNKLNFSLKKYNSHNQYFYVWLSSGILGLILFLSWMFFYYRIAFIYKDYIMLSVLILYSISFLFENVLSRQSGVIFFSFIINFLYYYNIKNEK